MRRFLKVRGNSTCKMQIIIYLGIALFFPTYVSSSCTELPPPISNGWRVYTTNSATYYCYTGYYGHGDNTIRCFCNWICCNCWDSLNFECRIYDCGTPASLSNGRRSYNGTTYGNAAKYACDTGYLGRGTDNIVCQSNGVWSALDYQCHIKETQSKAFDDGGEATKADVSVRWSVSWQAILPAVGVGIILIIVVVIVYIRHKKRETSKPYETSMVDRREAAPYSTLNIYVNQGHI